VSFVGAVGDDEFGRAARQALVEDGVNVDSLVIYSRFRHRAWR
jgi:sugar/nucleoside kinase (ribokinase family)